MELVIIKMNILHTSIYYKLIVLLPIKISKNGIYNYRGIWHKDASVFALKTSKFFSNVNHGSFLVWHVCQLMENVRRLDLQSTVYSTYIFWSLYPSTAKRESKWRDHKLNLQASLICCSRSLWWGSRSQNARTVCSYRHPVRTWCWQDCMNGNEEEWKDCVDD